MKIEVRNARDRYSQALIGVQKILDIDFAVKAWQPRSKSQKFEISVPPEGRRMNLRTIGIGQ